MKKRVTLARPASMREIFEALDADICHGLAETRERGYSWRHTEVMDALKRAKLSKEMALGFAAHALLKVDDARRFIEQVTKFDPVIAHKLQIDRKNRDSARQPRERKGKGLRKEIKDMMRREKKNGTAFVDFLSRGMEGFIEGLTITKMRDGKYKLYTDSVAQTEALILKENSLSRWYFSKKK